MLSPQVLLELRVACTRAAHACGQWDSAKAQLRALCLSTASHPRLPPGLGWGLFNAIAGRARQRSYDERWLLRLLMREPSSPHIAAGVAHNCLLSRSFKVAMAEYLRLHERFPDEPLLILCIAIAQMQQVMSRMNKERTQSVLHAFGWLSEYARRRDAQEAAYNTGRAYHHLGLSHLAVRAYEKVLQISRARARPQRGELHPSAEGRDLGRELDPSAEDGDLGREAAHNLARICCASGSRDLARQIVRSMPVV